MGVERLRFDKHTELIPSRLNDIAKLLTSNITQDSLKNTTGKYPVFGANSIVGYIDYYHQDKPYSAIIKDGAGVGRTTYNPGKSSVIGTMNYIVPKESVNSVFLFYFLNQINFKKYVIGSTIPHIYFKDYKNVKLMLPSKSEQEKIGNFLSLFDRLIEKLETKIGLLKELKKGYLQQMFPSKGEPVPKIRFAGFEEDWVEYQLGDISTRITRKNNVDNQNTLTISGSQGLVSQEEYFSKRVASSDLKNYTLIYKNDFAYNKSYSNGYPMGAIKRLNKYEIGVVSSLYICFKLTEKIDNNFIESYFDTGITNDQLTRVSAEGARNHGLLNISPPDFFSIKISIPDFLEQEKIGNFFKNLDAMIEKQEKELDAIEELKKGYMQRLFA